MIAFKCMGIINSSAVLLTEGILIIFLSCCIDAYLKCDVFSTVLHIL